MNRVKVVADNVDKNLRVTTDCKDNHVNGKVPVLDLEVWIGKDEQGKMKVLYNHYMKPVANRTTIHWRSAHSLEMKKNVAINEMVRINRNLVRISHGKLWHPICHTTLKGYNIQDTLKIFDKE